MNLNFYLILLVLIGMTLYTDLPQMVELEIVTYMFQALMDHPDFTSTRWNSVRICISGGAPMPGPLCDKFEKATGVRMAEGYGLTESSGVVSANPYEGARKLGTIGIDIFKVHAIQGVVIIPRHRREPNSDRCCVYFSRSV